MTPAARDLPVITATWNAIARRWELTLPGNYRAEARDESEVENLVARFAYGAAIRYQRTPVAG